VFQEELAERRRDAGAAAVYATHDAGEALAIADRVVLLREGRVAQDGTPEEIYERPVDLWAAMLTGPASIVRPSRDGAGTPVLVRPEWVELDGGPIEGVVRAFPLPRSPHRLRRRDRARTDHRA
jgi:ABC-type Fe3+/spermidine/putrescine transport system ATPase subunit